MCPAATKLLISVRDPLEAALVRDAGVDWIDLKEPNAGSLGCPRLDVAQEVACLLSSHAQRSVALGELCDLNDNDFQVGEAFNSSSVASFAKLFPVLKVGLSGCRSPQADWQSRFKAIAGELRERGSELIPVAYADAALCSAPELNDVLQLAKQLGSTHLLIDTFTKDGRSLLDWLPLEKLKITIAAARQFRCGIVLAGSLRIQDAQQLLALNPAALAIRGAVCQSNEVNGRTTQIDSTKVACWRALIR